MSASSKASPLPELVFGIVGAIGIDIDQIVETISNSLSGVGYDTELIKLTQEMMSEPVEDLPPPKGGTFADEITYKMDYANALCRRFGDPATLGRIGVRAIMRRRATITGGAESIAPATAFVIRQLKRPEEVELLRQLYGKQFILVAAYGSEDQRKTALEKRLKGSMPTRSRKAEITAAAEKLIERDADEEGNTYGQHLRDTFHLADVFVDGLKKQEMEAKFSRFVNALFGRNDISPSKSEYGMYAAKSASLRSADLSRQVGAAIFSDDGELITQGCNEVPKAFGGTYWDLEEPDYRDIRLGQDPNDAYKREIIRDFVERLAGGGLLSEKALKIGATSKIVDKLISKAGGEHGEDGALIGSSILDVTEFGRIVHAEMCAICDAARLGKSVKGATLYCTTFPCHNCTKHILAAGIRRVVYMEPYPKSKAKELHENEIEIEQDSKDRVSFMPFLGISPYRYRDIFQKGKRKGRDGKARRWYYEVPQPMIEVAAPSYLVAEPLVVSTTLLGDVSTPPPEVKVPDRSEDPPAGE